MMARQARFLILLFLIKLSPDEIESKS